MFQEFEKQIRFFFFLTGSEKRFLDALYHSVTCVPSKCWASLCRTLGAPTTLIRLFPPSGLVRYSRVYTLRKLPQEGGRQWKGAEGGPRLGLKCPCCVDGSVAEGAWAIRIQERRSISGGGRQRVWHSTHDLRKERWSDASLPGEESFW